MPVTAWGGDGRRSPVDEVEGYTTVVREIVEAIEAIT